MKGDVLTPEALEGVYLLRLIVDNVKQNLEEKLVEAVRPMIRETVEKVVAELEPGLQACNEEYARRLSIVLTVKEMPR